MKTTQSKNRRKFLLAAGLGGAGAVAAAVATGGKAVPAGGKQASAQDAAQGYRVTAHIEKYYKTTEV